MRTVAALVLLAGSGARAAVENVDYITVTRASKQYFVMDYIPTSNTTIEVTCSFPTVGQAMTLFCARGTQTQDRSFTCFSTSGNQWRYDYFRCGTTAGSVAANTQYRVRCSYKGLYVNDTLVKQEYSLLDSKAANKVSFFGSYTGATNVTPAPNDNFLQGNVYGIRIWEGEVTDANLLYDLRPVMTEGGVGALADSKHGDQVYENMGATGAFTVPTKTYTWKGTGTTAAENKWSVGTNWEGDAAPQAGELCEVVIPSASYETIENDITGLRLKSLTLSSATAFTLTGNSIAFTTAGSFTCSGANKTISMPMALAAGATNLFTFAENTTITLSEGTLTGQGGFKKDGLGTMILAGDNTFDGGVVIYKGYVEMSTTRALGTAYKTIKIGPNHDSGSANYTKLTLTKAMNFEYNLDFVKQSGPFYYSAQYLFCPANTRLKGTVRATTAQSYHLLQATSGNLYVDNDVYLYYRFSSSTPVYFNGFIHKVGTGSTDLNFQNPGAVAHLNAAKSEIDSIYLGYGGAEFETDFAVWSNLVLRTQYQYGTGAVNLNGHDQVIGGVQTDYGNWNTQGHAYHNIATANGKPCRLTIMTKANYTGRYKFVGPLTLAIDSPWGKTQAVVNAESTMTGSLIVSSGAFKIGYNCDFAYVPSIEIGANGVLIATNGVSVGTGDSTLALRTGGKLVLENGETMSVKSVAIDGAIDKTLYGKDLCAVGAGVEGATEVSWIEGSGVLTVNPNTVADDPHTWSGGAGQGSAAESMENPLNWGMSAGDTPPALDGGLVATFATAGTNAWFADGLALNKLIFNAPNDFNLTAQSDEGVAMIAAQGVEASGGHTYTIDAGVELGLGQTWTVASGTTLAAIRGLTSSGNYAWTASGGGTVVLSGDVTLSGNMDVSATKLILRDAEVTEETGKLSLLNTTAKLVLDNATVRKPMAFAVENNSSALTTEAGSTNAVLADIKWASGCTLRIGADSQLTFGGAVSSIGYSECMGTARDTSTLIVQGGTLNGNYFTLNNITVHLWSQGNAIMDYWTVNPTAALYLHVTNSLTAQTALIVRGTIDLCGKPQICGCLKDSEATGVITSAEPAVLTVCQRYSASNKTDADGNRTNSCAFVGAAGLRKTTASDLALTAVHPTTGSLDARGGKLILTETASWKGTDVSVSGEDAVLVLNSSGNLNRRTNLSITAPGGRVSVASGVTQRVRSMSVAEVSTDPSSGEMTTNMINLAYGVYTSANCDYVTGGGAINVVDPGFIVIFR